MATSSISDLLSQMANLHTTTPLTGLITPASMMAMAITFLTLGILLTTIRFATRKMQRLSVGWDDWLIIPALVLMAAMCVNMIVAVAMQRFGYKLPPRLNEFGMPDPWDGWAPEIGQDGMFEYIQELIAPMQLAFTKLSIIFFYRRVLVAYTRGVFHWVTIILIVIVALWGIGLGAGFTFVCGTRFSVYWLASQHEFSDVCIGHELEIILFFSDVILDAIILLLPIPSIFRLQLSLRKKLLVTAAFMMGALTIVVAVIRAVMLSGILANTSGDDFLSADESTAISQAMYWGLLESGLSIVVACLPALQYLFTRSGPLQLVRSVADSIRSVSRLSFLKSSSSNTTTNSSVTNSTLRSESHVGLVPNASAMGNGGGSLAAARSNVATPPTDDVEKANQGARHIGLVALKSHKSMLLAAAMRSAPATPLVPPTPMSAKSIHSNFSTSTSTTVTYIDRPLPPHPHPGQQVYFGGEFDEGDEAARYDEEFGIHLPPLPPPPPPYTPRTPHTPHTPFTPFTPMSGVSELSAVSDLDDRIDEREVKMDWI